jgi:hypothetical protein
MLHIPVSYQAGFVLHNIVGLIMLDYVHSLEPECLVADRGSSEFPGLIVLDGPISSRTTSYLATSFSALEM